MTPLKKSLAEAKQSVHFPFLVVNSKLLVYTEITMFQMDWTCEIYCNINMRVLDHLRASINNFQNNKREKIILKYKQKTRGAQRANIK